MKEKIAPDSTVADVVRSLANPVQYVRLIIWNFVEGQYDRDAAVACAEAFLRLAEPLVVRIGKDVEESTQSHPFLPSMGDVAAAAMKAPQAGIGNAGEVRLDQDRRIFHRVGGNPALHDLDRAEDRLDQ